MIEITSIKNPLIKEIKSLYRKKERMKSKTFIIEGIKIIEEAIDHSYSIKNIIYTDKLMNTKGGLEFFETIKDREELIFVPDNIFREISDTENPQGVLAIARFRFEDLDKLKEKENPSLIFLDRLQDPGNMGTIIRTADAFNMDGIIITDGSVDPYNPKVVRATMGSIFRLPIYYIEDSIQGLSYLKENGLRIFSTSLEGSLPIYDIDYNKGFILVIGNESTGVSDEIYSLSDELIRIPMPGRAESLNAGVAASIIMYESMKQGF